MKNLPAAINKQKTHHTDGGVPNVSIKKYVGLKGGGMAGKLFKGKETFAEEKKEAQAVKSGKISPANFVQGEKSEGHKEENSGKLAMAIKTGKLSPTAYAKKEAKEPEGMMCGGTAKVKKMAAGGKVRGCGIATKGLTKGKMV